MAQYAKSAARIYNHPEKKGWQSYDELVAIIATLDGVSMPVAKDRFDAANREFRKRSRSQGRRYDRECLSKYGRVK